jgi:hypothetical protein
MVKQNMGLTLNQEIFIGITFIVIIIIMILVKDKILAILIVGLIANFLAISSQLILINERHMHGNRFTKNDFENTESACNNTSDNMSDNTLDNIPAHLIPREPLVIEQFNAGYDLYREPCRKPSKLLSYNSAINQDSYNSTINQDSNSDYSDYEGKIDELSNNSSKPNKLSKMIDTNNINYDSDAKYIREQIIRGENDRINPVNNNRKLVEKYIIPDVIEEENKPWWG